MGEQQKALLRANTKPSVELVVADLDYEVISGGAAEGGYTCSVKINDTEAAVAKAGINIVIYNNTTMKVIDSVCYNGQIVR